MLEEGALKTKTKQTQEPERAMPTDAHNHGSLEGDNGSSEDERLGHDEDDEDDEADDSVLQKAARAGIQLLEENAQFADEVRELQLRLAHGHEQTQEMSRMIDDKEAQVDQLTQHLRESIRENQRLLAELTQAKKETLSFADQLAKPHGSPRKRLVRAPSPKQRAQQTQQRMRSKSLLVSLEQASIFRTISASAMRSDPVVLDGQDNQQNLATASSSVGLNSPKRRQATAKLDEVEAKYEEEHRRNSVLKIELQSAQKKISEIKPLNAQLHEAKEEIQVLRTQADELEKKLALSWEERAEERELIQSLRTTVQIYQKLDDPNMRIKDGEQRSHYRGIDAGEDAQARSLSRMRRRKSDGCIFPKAPPPNRWTGPDTEESFQSRDETNDVILEALDNLAEQLLQLKQPELLFPPRSPKSSGMSVTPSFSTTVISMDDACIGGVAITPRSRFLEQQVAVLQDLLKRYRSQWRESSEKRCAIETENIRLLSRVEELTRLLQRQCDVCVHANESITKEEAWQSAVPSYEVLLQQAPNTEESKIEDDAEAEHACFSILRQLTDSWTADKSKRMRFHDWLTNAIRSTGIRRPLYLPDLTREIASGFEVLLIPILREKFGVQILVEKRLRSVIVTDLRLQVAETDSEKARARLRRIRRSLMWLVDAEATQLEGKDWLDEISRWKAARMCLDKYS